MRAADAHYRAQTILETTTELAARQLWRRMDETDFDSSWLTIGYQVRAIITAAQLSAARAGAQLVVDALAELNVSARPAVSVKADRLAGVTSFGDDLSSALRRTVIVSKVAVGHGATAADALQVGGRLLAGIVTSQIADANRTATRIGIVATPGIGYARYLEHDSCPRCRSAAARAYSWRTGFARHPRCRCRPTPAPPALAADMAVDFAHPVSLGGVAGLSVSGQHVTSPGLRRMPEALISATTRREDAVTALVAHGFAQRAA